MATKPKKETALKRVSAAIKADGGDEAFFEALADGTPWAEFRKRYGCSGRTLSLSPERAPKLV